MSTIYIFSGLGADYRAFEKIDFGNLQIVHISWISPQKNETIENYAQTISEKILDENPILIGLSFGGMMLMEIAKIKKAKQIILISSAKTKYELPWLYRFLGKIKATKLIPNSILTKSNFVLNWLFGANSIEEKQLLKAIIKDTDILFMKWAINEISHWKNVEIPTNVIHIHGNNDKIIPIRNVEADFTIQNGSHLMTLNKSKEIKDIIFKICKT
ncbi:alpha/beta hydrolase [Flavobacterium sp. I3-2]|uniref:alpha/beta hydrolase n=1 Tax=Flavobacterium sp. I3-2 TaxID=2748319 RepID=UPI0015B1E089|nr:alpha/beta hydrolase [Flavobacterium sp. I3-2]